MTNTQMWILVGTISFWGLGIYYIVARVGDSICDELRKLQERQGESAEWIVRGLREGL